VAAYVVRLLGRAPNSLYPPSDNRRAGSPSAFSSAPTAGPDKGRDRLKPFFAMMKQTVRTTFNEMVSARPTGEA
jgi:hypothetical protein